MEAGRQTAEGLAPLRSLDSTRSVMGGQGRALGSPCGREAGGEFWNQVPPRGAIWAPLAGQGAGERRWGYQEQPGDWKWSVRKTEEWSVISGFPPSHKASSEALSCLGEDWRRSRLRGRGENQPYHVRFPSGERGSAGRERGRVWSSEKSGLEKGLQSPHLGCLSWRV